MSLMQGRAIDGGQGRSFLQPELDNHSTSMFISTIMKL